MFGYAEISELSERLRAENNKLFEGINALTEPFDTEIASLSARLQADNEKLFEIAGFQQAEMEWMLKKIDRARNRKPISLSEMVAKRGQIAERLRKKQSMEGKTL